jgi:hypothetical protein
MLFDEELLRDTKLLLSVCGMSVDHMSVAEVSVDLMSVDEVGVCR